MLAGDQLEAHGGIAEWVGPDLVEEPAGVGVALLRRRQVERAVAVADGVENLQAVEQLAVAEHLRMRVEQRCEIGAAAARMGDEDETVHGVCVGLQESRMPPPKERARSGGGSGITRRTARAAPAGQPVRTKTVRRSQKPCDTNECRSSGPPSTSRERTPCRRSAASGSCSRRPWAGMATVPSAASQQAPIRKVGRPSGSTAQA